jgi:hypothetical protein
MMALAAQRLHRIVLMIVSAMRATVAVRERQRASQHQQHATRRLSKISGAELFGLRSSRIMFAV